ncbi:unnamed protein product [Oreochromis niloticus]|nr:unnamed protein product [Mustela putorius furo]
MLDDLGEEQLKRFHFYLQNEPVGDFQTIKKSRLENADRLKTVDVMIQSYSDHAMEVATLIIMMMNNKRVPNSGLTQGSEGTQKLVEPAGVLSLSQGLRKYSCQLTIDTNTAQKYLKLSDNNRRVTCTFDEVQSYPDHPDRFDGDPQLLCRNGLTGCCYWEVEWKGKVHVSVSYGRIKRKGISKDSSFGGNDLSWCLICSNDDTEGVFHNNRLTSVSSSSSSVSNRVAVMSFILFSFFHPNRSQQMAAPP